MSQQDGFWCIVPAAGSGSRFAADRPKQHVEIAGRTLLNWTLSALAAHPRIAGLVVVVAVDDRYWNATLAIGKPMLVALGGDQRADSVLAGLDVLPASVGDTDFVLVHDAARPCIRIADIDALLDSATQGDGGLLAAPLRDTLKLADSDGYVMATEPREARWRALTPQMFRRQPLAGALAEARAAGIVITDEAMAMERAGFRPLLVEGHDDNLKVTTPADRELAEFLLRQR